MSMTRRKLAGGMGIACCCALYPQLASADPFTVSFGVNGSGAPDTAIGGIWNTTYVQGFSPSVSPNPNPGASASDTVTLSQFQFFKSGTADTATNIRLAILNNIYPNSPNRVVETTTLSPTLVGLSTNTITDTTGIATNAPISFSFNNIPLTYGSNYAAVFVNIGTTDLGGGAFAVTPVLVSALTANYTDVGGGDFQPTQNYGGLDNYQYVTGNFINAGGYFMTFNRGGDADFIATLNSAATVTGSSWTGTTNAVWGGSANNWNPSGVPNAVGATVNFGSIASGNYAVALDAGGDTVGVVNFAGATPYTIGTTGGASLTLQVSSGQAAINDNSGNHTLGAPVNLVGNTTITTVAGTTLTFSSPLVTANTLTVTKAGAGTMGVERVATGTLNITDGNVKVSAKGSPNSASGTSVLTNLFVQPAGSIDVTNNALILTGGTTADVIRQMILSGRITTSAAAGGHALGYASNTDLGRSTFGGLPVGANDALIGYTFSGDANLDGKVNGLDFNSLATNYGPTTGKVWIQGDFNYDGGVNSLDFDALATNFDQALSPAPGPGLGVLVPEPTLLLAPAIGALWGLARRRR